MDIPAKKVKDFTSEDELGFLFRGLQEIESFYPCFRTMMKQD